MIRYTWNESGHLHDHEKQGIANGTMKAGIPVHAGMLYADADGNVLLDPRMGGSPVIVGSVREWSEAELAAEAAAAAAAAPVTDERRAAYEAKLADERHAATEAKLAAQDAKLAGLSNVLGAIAAKLGIGG